MMMVDQQAIQEIRSWIRECRNFVTDRTSAIAALLPRSVGEPDQRLTSDWFKAHVSLDEIARRLSLDLEDAIIPQARALDYQLVTLLQRLGKAAENHRDALHIVDDDQVPDRLNPRKHIRNVDRAAAEYRPLFQQIEQRLTELSLGAGPSGALRTLTFLMTDIEGHSALMEARPQAMKVAVEQHNSLARRVIEEHNGRVIKDKGEGDSLFTVFECPSDAIHATVELQAAFALEPWPEGLSIKVRMGIHTGEASESDGDYHTPVANRCGRIRGLACGGQIICSKLAYDIAAPNLQNVYDTDLGTKELTGIGPEHLVQVSRRAPVQPHLVNLPVKIPECCDSGWLLDQQRQSMEVLSQAGFRDDMEVWFHLTDIEMSKNQKELKRAISEVLVPSPYPVPIGGTGTLSPVVQDAGLSLQFATSQLATRWVLRRDGSFYQMQSLVEDPELPRFVCPYDRVTRVIEALVFCRRLYTKLGVDITGHAHMAVRHIGLRDRVLKSGRYVWPVEGDHRAIEDEHIAFLTVPISIDTEGMNLAGYVTEVMAPFLMLFDCFELDDSVYEAMAEAYWTVATKARIIDGLDRS